MNKICILISIFLLTASLSGCGEEQEKIQPSGKSIRIGFIGPVSGPDKVLGGDSLKGVQTVLHMEPYLSNGDTIELLVEDDKNDPALAVKAFKKLVEKDKVTALIVASSSGAALAINELADHYQTPVVILLASHPDISKETKYVSQITFDNTFQAKVAALFVRDELLLERVAVFTNPDSYHSKSLSEEFIRKFRSIEGEIDDVVSVSQATTDYGEILSHLRDRDVQLLYLPMAVENVIEISKELQAIGWSPEVMGGDGLLTRVFAEKRDDTQYLEGFFATDLYSNNMEMTVYGRKVVKGFHSLFEKKNSTFVAIGVEGMAILMNAVNRCKESSDKECINSKLHATVDFEGLLGNITIQPDGKALRALAVNRIREDQLEFVVKVY